ncbi:3-oxoacyl-[acyl-carrier-protein] synthase 2 [Actinomadura sp. RB99]|uniref:beta-ketoacyl-[acyl-carrier-protein] synthase family protein n=1 Tax=Actinomadura sp. RB99 TaxID=2691577 RepID=UPI001689ED8B|nr:beta-ketoacyl-[acyl-carrier-protein] synthase family protein [Actinomadura sp. RB99]MBD2892435.1 3-oxoacyl-[acyl-carrier-protein] synthase 2 [Actinomadura sp. RB99]
MSEAAVRVVVTGIGVISSIGTGAEEFTRGLREGRSGISPITSFDTTGFEHVNGGEVHGFMPAEWIRRTPVETLGRAARFSVAAARMAVADAGLTDPELAGRRAHICVGTTDGESRELDLLTEYLLEAEPQRGVRGAVPPRATQLAEEPRSWIPKAAAAVPAGRLSAAIAAELGMSDVDASTLTTACSAGNYAIGSGLDALRLGEADLALCGGADAVCRKTFTAFYRLGTIAPDVCRPFDKDREGIITGEGGAVLVLETLESARRRGARIYAEVLGYGLNCDAYHPVAPDQDSIARCMELALKDADVRPEQVDLISAHGTGTKANDVTECRAVHAVFGGRPPRTVSLKSMLGHTMGAASALAAAACSLALTHGFVPPTINHRETDPECDIDCVPNRFVPADLEIVQSNGLAFAGNNCVVLFGKYKGQGS